LYIGVIDGAVIRPTSVPCNDGGDDRDDGDDNGDNDDIDYEVMLLFML
jgi:hypothetical protein